MDSALVQKQITEQLVQRLKESKYLDYPLMSRIEGHLGTTEQLGLYIAVLVQKLEERDFRDEWLSDRIDSLLLLHQRFERYEQSGATTAAEYRDALAANGN